MTEKDNLGLSAFLDDIEMAPQQQNQQKNKKLSETKESNKIDSFEDFLDSSPEEKEIENSTEEFVNDVQTSIEENETIKRLQKSELIKNLPKKSKDQNMEDEESNVPKGLLNQDVRKEALRNILEDEENFQKCISLLNQDLKGFRAVFVGEMSGTKLPVLKKLSSFLVKIGKIKTEKIKLINFNEIEEFEEWDTDKLYVISNLSDAYINLFVSRNNEETNAKISRYEHMLESLLNAPRQAYIILDCANNTSKINFFDIDPRISLIFSKICTFPDYSNEKIANDLIAQTGSKILTQEEIVDFLYRNRKYYPFKNQELTNYLTMDYLERGSLPPNKDESFDLEETLNKFIGMEDAKDQIRRMHKYLKADKLFRDNNIDIGKARFSLSTMFLGDPGTGKTTLARVLSHLYYQMGFLEQDKMIELTGTDLMASSEAASAIKTSKALNDAMGGCLFIDEIYSLTSDAAIATIVKSMEDNVGRIAIFGAGYFMETMGFLARNSGLASRFGSVIKINPYTEEELTQIYFLKMRNLGFTIEDSDQLRRRLKPLLGYAVRVRSSGNGRFIDRCVQATLLIISEKYLSGKIKDITVVNHEVIPPIAEVVKTSI